MPFMSSEHTNTHVEFSTHNSVQETFQAQMTSKHTNTFHAQGLGPLSCKVEEVALLSLLELVPASLARFLFSAPVAETTTLELAGLESWTVAFECFPVIPGAVACRVTLA
jgi:hypothetical protein